MSRISNMKTEFPASRRVFLETAAAVGAGSLLSPIVGSSADTNLSSGHGRDDSSVSSSARGWGIPRPMFWSFENNDPRFSMAGFSFSFQVFTAGLNQNTYSVYGKNAISTQKGNLWTVEAPQLSWPGQQMHAQGTLHAEVERTGKVIKLHVEATAEEPIHAIKTTIHGLPKGSVAQSGWQVTPTFEAATKEGTLHCYPTYNAGMPVWFLGDRDEGISFSSLDTTFTPKRFCAVLRDDGVQIQLIAEAEAKSLGTRFSAPPWKITTATTLEVAIRERMQLLEENAGLKTWEVRSDVAPWVRKVSLVVTLHGMHWSGYIFNDYQKMAEIVGWVTDRIPGERVLFFLAGWEGRYYRQYGDSKPDVRMGGAEGLRRLVQRIHSRGAHIMAMFAGNSAGPTTPGLAELVLNSSFNSLPGPLKYDITRGYRVDWAEIRAGAGDGGSRLNPGASGWREHLIRQVSDLNQRFDFDGNFFDTQPNIENDMENDPLVGLRKLSESLRENHEGLFIATESWFDLSLEFIPCSQTLDGPGHWSARYQRRFAHVSLGEPSRGSTGVHEVGHIDYDLNDLLRTFDWPTLAIVDGTIDVAPGKVEAVISAAKLKPVPRPNSNQSFAW
jgi:hypothetical protein